MIYEVAQCFIPEKNICLSDHKCLILFRETYLESFKLTAQEELRSVNEALANIPAVEHTDTFQPPPFTGGHFAGAPPGHFPGQFGAPGFPSYHWGAGGHVPGNHMPDVSHFPGSAEWGQADYQDPVRFIFIRLIKLSNLSFTWCGHIKNINFLKNIFSKQLKGPANIEWHPFHNIGYVGLVINLRLE